MNRFVSQSYKKVPNRSPLYSPRNKEPSYPRTQRPVYTVNVGGSNPSAPTIHNLLSTLGLQRFRWSLGTSPFLGSRVHESRLGAKLYIRFLIHPRVSWGGVSSRTKPSKNPRNQPFWSMKSLPPRCFESTGIVGGFVFPASPRSGDTPSPFYGVFPTCWVQLTFNKWISIKFIT